MMRRDRMAGSITYCSTAAIEVYVLAGVRSGAAAGGRRLTGMCTAVMYPGMCARCARKTGYNISPSAAADRLFAVKDDEMARRTLLDAGGMVFT